MTEALMNQILINNTIIKIILGDITELEVDAMVNAANNQLLMGGGVAGAIKRNGGQVIEDEAVKKGPIPIGQAVATTAGKLKARYVIHAATMGLDFQTDEIKVRDSCRHALTLASELNVRSMAFPALGCGVGGFPVTAAAKIMAQEVLKHLRETKTSLTEIIFCLYAKEDYSVFAKNALGYLDYIVNQLKSPYLTVDAIIEQNSGIVLIERSNPPGGWALPGGFVDYGESLEAAVIREVKEETNLVFSDVKQFHTYSDPDRDPRFHTVSTVFTGRAEGDLRAGDDAAAARIFNTDKLPEKMAFDHRRILAEYLEWKKKNPC
jgi:O-acetyl-ADP-ribose deacetylase (regulator of RNase III)/ADP-ribose pyrophosphatase YjhB (NUDIX family)